MPDGQAAPLSAVSHTPSRGLVDLLRANFTADPTRVAFQFLENGETVSQALTAGALDRHARTVAATLRAAGSVGDRALLLYPSGPEFVAAFLGCLYAGVTPVPCVPPAGTRRGERLATIATDADARFALGNERTRAQIESRYAESDAFARLHWLSLSDTDDAAADNWQMPAIGPETLALLQYTSGSTSDPRGVMVTHRHLIDDFRDFNIGWTHGPESVFVNWLPVFHDLGLIYGLLQPLLQGCLCVMMPPAAFLQSPIRWLRAVSQFRGTHAAAPNFAYDLCVSRITAEQRRELDLSSWRVALNAAEPIRADTLERFAETFAECGLDRRVLTPGYGLAESTLKVTTAPESALATVLALDAAALGRDEIVVSAPQPSQTATTSLLIGCGVPVPETELRIVDPNTCAAVASNRVGEVWIGGRIVAEGYWRREEETAATFGARLPGEPEKRWLRTGDLGFLHQGELFITGRRKDIIIIHGLNHYPQDIERTVESSHAALRATGCAAIGIDAEGEERLVILAEIERGAIRGLDAAAVFAAIREAVAETHAIAAHAILLLKPNALAKTSSGKLRRGLYRIDFTAGAFEPLAAWEAAAPNQPIARPTQAAIRDRLTQRFATRLGVAPNTIDQHAPLSLLGIDSAEAVALAAELQNWLGGAVPETIAFDYPTIAALAQHLTGTAAHPHDQATAAAKSSAIAVVGLGCRFPGAANPDEFWQLLHDGVDAVGEPPAWRRETLAGRQGGFLDGIDQFDPEFFGISPREAERTDPQQRLLLEVGWDALEDAGIAPDGLSGSRTGVFVGIANSDYARLMMQGDHADIYLGTGSALSIAANRLSYQLDLRGPSLAIDTACSSSLAALVLAVQSLRRGECDLALAGGVNLVLSPEYTIAFATAQMLAPDGRCKAFDANANGYVRGEGAGIAVLKRFDDAERDGDRILAVVRGVAMNQDGRTAGLTAPNGPAQQEVIRAALRDADLTPDRIGYIEAHGTGTPLGDPIEVNALAAVLLPERPGRAPCFIGSVKTNIGHLESAAGIAGFIKAVLALSYRTIPASLHCHTLNPRLEIAGTPLRIATEQRDWTHEGGRPRAAGVSSFGFGGTNTHAVIEEYAPRLAPYSAAPERPLHLLTLSARDHAGLTELAGKFSQRLGQLSDDSFADICATAATGRTGMPERLAIPAANAASARDALIAWSHTGRAGASNARLISGRAERRLPGVVFLFTGHGGQYPGMGRDLYRIEPVFRAAIDRCSAILQPEIDAALSEVLYGTAPAALDDMRLTQPALFAVEYALSQLWASWGIEPAAVIGHSLGEYAAACAAGALSLEDGLKLVAARGRLFETLSGDGAMVAAMADRETVESAFGPWAAQLSIAAVNAPSSCVFSGNRAATQFVSRNLTARGIKCTELAVAHASHSPLVDDILDAFADTAASVCASAPKIPLVSNLTGTWQVAAPDAAYWRAHMRQPVLFQAGLETLIEAGHQLFLEIGPHATLSAIGEQWHDRPERLWTSSLVREETPHSTMLAALGALWTRGAQVDWAGFEQGRSRRRVSLPTTTFRRRRCWISPSPAQHRIRPDPTAHPLLGSRLQLAAGKDVVFESRLPGSNANYLAQHRVFGVPVLPIAAYLDMAIAATEGAFGTSTGWQIDDLALLQPLCVTDGQERVVQTVITSDGNSLRSWSVYSRAESSEGDWTLHATGRIVRSDELQADRIGAGEFPTKTGGVDTDQFYRQLTSRAIDLDGGSRRLTGLRLDDRTAIGQLDGIADDPPVYSFVGSLLDSALPVAGAVLGADASGTWLPASVERVRIARTSRPIKFCRAQLRRDTGTAKIVDLECFDDLGNPAAELAGLSFVHTTRAAFNGNDRDFYGTAWIETQPRRSAPPSGAIWLIFADRAGTGDAVADRLASPGDVVVVRQGDRYERDGDRSFCIRNDSPADYERLLNELPAVPSVILHLWSLDAQSSLTPEALRDATVSGSASAALLLQALRRRQFASTGRIWLATRRAQAVEGPTQDAGLLQAPLWGVGKTIALEHPEHWGGLVDLDETSVTDAARRLIDHIGAADGEDHVAFRGGRRFAARIGRKTATTHSTLDPRATYLITGGLGALGLAIASHIAAAGARHLMLVGRTGAEGPESQAAIRVLETSGVQARARAVDIRNADQVTALLAEIERSGPPLRGIVHAAGVPGYLSLDDMTGAAIAEMFGAKIEGALALCRATQDTPLDFFACVSSMVGSWGAGHQAHYAAANQFLDQLAQSEIGRNIVTIALGPLAGGMLPADIAANMERLGVASSTVEAAAETVVGLLGARGHFIAADIDWSRYRTILEPQGPRPLFEQIEQAETPHSTAAAKNRLADQLGAVSAAERHRLIAGEIITEAAQVLGMDQREWPGLDRGFFDLGMNSLTALELRRALERTLGRTMPPTLVFDHPNVGALATEIGGWFDDGSAPAHEATAHQKTTPANGNGGATEADDDTLLGAGDTDVALRLKLERLEAMMRAGSSP